MHNIFKVTLIILVMSPFIYWERVQAAKTAQNAAAAAVIEEQFLVDEFQLDSAGLVNLKGQYALMADSFTSFTSFVYEVQRKSTEP